MNAHSSPTVIVLADGCFDPLHEGHLAYLEAAASLGTRLVVNVADDKEIWEKRPVLGPFLNEKVRWRLIGGLKPVDEVITAGTLEALRSVRPQIYVKGIDWKDRLPEEEMAVCTELGIRVEYLDTVSNSSTGMLNAFLRQVKH